MALAWFNGANDVAKGIATLVGSGGTAPRCAVLWGGLWTVLGGLAAMIWGIALVDTFSCGLLAPGFPADLIYLASAVLGATAWVMLATQIGLPVCTPRALLGRLIGAALAVGPSGLRAFAKFMRATVGSAWQVGVGKWGLKTEWTAVFRINILERNQRGG